MYDDSCVPPGAGHEPDIWFEIYRGAPPGWEECEPPPLCELDVESPSRAAPEGVRTLVPAALVVLVLLVLVAAVVEDGGGALEDGVIDGA